MDIIDSKQVLNILQNLSNLEISYMEYSKTPKNFVKYQTYMEYFNNYVIKSHNLSRFYFPLPLPDSCDLPQYISELGEITEQINITPGFDFSVVKQFNFPAGFRHSCDYYTGIYMLNGHGTLELDEESFELNLGDFYLIPPKIYYGLTTKPESICICFNLRQSFIATEYRNLFQEDPLLTSFTAKTLASEHTMTYLVLHTNGNDSVNLLVLTIFAEYINQDKYSKNIMKNCLSLLFAMILRDKRTTVDSSIKITRIDQQYGKIVDYLKQNYQTATLTSVSEHIHFSKQYICKIVKHKTGDTFNTLLIQIRLKVVEQYLLETDLTLENISYLCGFAAASHLSKVFKKNYGVSPSEYKKMHLLNTEE